MSRNGAIAWPVRTTGRWRRHVSWHAGGMASVSLLAGRLDDLREFVRRQPADAALLLVGNGSNLLVRDGGLMAR